MEKEIIKLSSDKKDLLIELSEQYETITKEDIDLFETTYTAYDEMFIEKCISACAYWLLRKDHNTEKDWADKQTKKREISICERIKNRVAKYK